MRLDLSKTKVYNGCLKPGCNKKPCVRHHRGGEHTFVRHFAWMGRGKRYVSFVRRYDEFRKEDVVDVCLDHHEEIHLLIEEHDIEWQFENDCIKSYASFSWTEAEALIASRRAVTDLWLIAKTPGVKTRRLTNWK